MFSFSSARLAALLAGGGAAAALGLAGATTAFAASTPTAQPSPAAASRHHGHAAHSAVSKAIFEGEADVLGLTPDQLRDKLKAGAKVSDLAADKGITKDQFAARLAANVKPRLEQLVDQKVIDQARADKIVDRIQKGWVPFWDGRHKAAKKAA